MNHAITPPPAPSFLSDAVRAVLEVPIVRPTNPDIDDTAGWLSLVAQTDAMIADMFTGVTLPVTSELRDLAGVPTYEVTPPTAPVGEDAPVLLSMAVASSRAAVISLG